MYLKLLIKIHLMFVCLGILSCATSNTKQTVGPRSSLPMDVGKCYAKCFIQNQYITIKDSIPVYSNIDNVEYRTETIKLQDATTIWVKKKADRNCLSADPEDCLVWCHVDSPAQYKSVKIPLNPSMAGELNYEIIEKKKLSVKGGVTEWREVVCGDNITINLVRRVQTALMQQGYDVGNNGANNILGSETKAALVKFQRDNGLPVGQLDFETLKSLGIRNN